MYCPQALLEGGANVNAARTSDGMTALLWCSERGCAQIVQVVRPLKTLTISLGWDAWCHLPS